MPDRTQYLSGVVNLAMLGAGTDALPRDNVHALRRGVAMGGHLQLMEPGTYAIDQQVIGASDVTIELGAGVILDALDMSTNCITATGKDGFRLCGDGVIRCVAASAPSFTSCTGLSIDIRVEDASGNAIPPVLSDCAVAAPQVFGSGSEAAVTPFTALSLEPAGDSRFAAAYQTSASGATATAAIAIGDLVASNNGPQFWAEFLSGGALEVGDSYAVTGSRVSGSSAGSFSDQVASMLASSVSRSGRIALICSGANDLDAGISAAVMAAALWAKVGALIAAGIRVALCLEPPRKGSSWTTAIQAEWALYVAEQYAIRARYPEMVRLIDFITPVMNGAGTVTEHTSGLWEGPYYDNTHPRYLAGFLWAQAIVDGLGDWIFPGSFTRFLAADAALSTNLLNDPGMTGTDGTPGNSMTGDTPTNWTVTRSATNSWTNCYVWGESHKTHAVSTAYSVGDRVSSLTEPDYDYLCIAAGTSHSSPGAMSQTLFATTADDGGGGTLVWLTVPKFDGFDGLRCILAYGLGSVDNTRLLIRQDVGLSGAGLAVGDVVRGSIYVAALLPTYGFQLDLRATTAGGSLTKVKSAIGLGQQYPNTFMVDEYPMKGKIFTPKDDGEAGFVIPATTDNLRLEFSSNSRNGYTQAVLVTTPVLQEA